MIDNPDGRRVRFVRFSPEWIASLQTGTVFKIVQSPIPRGAHVVNCTYDVSTHEYFLLLEHEEFPLVVSGEQIPKLPLIRIERVA